MSHEEPPGDSEARPVPAHLAVARSVDAQRSAPVEPPKEPPVEPRRPPRIPWAVVAPLALLALGIWSLRSSPRSGPAVVADRATLERGDASQDVLPGSSAEGVVIVDERVEADLEGLRAAEIARLEAGSPPRSLPPCPSQDPVRGLRPWGGPCREAWLRATAWPLPDASPCRYQVFAAPPDDFRLLAECDADGDGEFETWAADRRTPPHRLHLRR